MLREINMENKIASIPLSRKKKLTCFHFFLLEKESLILKKWKTLRSARMGFFHVSVLFGIYSICIYPDVKSGNYEI